MAKAQSRPAESQNAWEGWISVIRMDEGKKKKVIRTNVCGTGERLKGGLRAKAHLCRHIPISRWDIGYERVVRLEDLGYLGLAGACI